MRALFVMVMFVFAIALRAQGLEMAISINQTEFKKYSREIQDTLFISCILKNTGSKSIQFRFSERYFVLSQAGENGIGHSHCFSVSPADYSKVYSEFYERTEDDFLKLGPGEELNVNGAYSVSWLCRSAPPAGDWRFKMSYVREITETDNFFLVKNYYTDKADSVFINDAWKGKLNSNSVEFVVK